MQKPRRQPILLRITACFVFLLAMQASFAVGNAIRSCDPRIISNNNYNFGPLQNCCCWHQGVVGCAPDGRRLCGDGTISPNCTCKDPSPFDIYAPPTANPAKDTPPNVNFEICEEVFKSNSCVIKRND